MTVWSDAQKKAIYTKNKNILVSASAGSGKTTVLIARLLHLIQDEKVEINQILAMTFTEAAANEMKKRLSSSLNEALNKTNDEDEKAYLQKQLASVSNAYISTIHGFCLNIIQNYYYVIGLAKERIANIMDEATSTALLDKSMYLTMQHFMRDQAYMNLCVQFSSKANSDENLKQDLIKNFEDLSTIVLILNNKIEGYLSYKIKERYAKKLDVDQLVVAEESRNKGFGKMLIEEAKNIAKKNNCHRIELNCWLFNENALAMYDHLGFEKQRIIYEMKTI